MKKLLKNYVLFVAVAAMLTACKGKEQTVETTVPVTTTAGTEAAAEATTAETLEAETEETTMAKEENITKASAEVSTDMSDDIYSFQAEINGALYTFPMSMEEFTSHGWEQVDQKDGELSPNQYTSSVRFRIKGIEIYGSMFNLGQDTIPLVQASIGGFNLNSYQAKGKDITVRLPKGIEYGTSSLDDVLAAYGEPTDRYDGSMYVQLTYRYDSYREIRIKVDSETKVINEVSYQNMVPVANGETTDSAKDADAVLEKSAEVLAYKAPTELGTDIRSFNVEYAGSLYTLPAPVSEFVDNGWTIQEDKTDMSIAGRNSGWVTMRKDNQSLKVMVNNYGKNGDSIYNCFLTSVKSAEYGPKVSITLPGNITMGMARDELLNALEGQDYTMDDSASTYTRYMVENYDSSLNYAMIYVSKESDKVNMIQLDNSPKELK